jgi:hypothetical protein
MAYAYSKALALESLSSHRLSEKYDEARKTYHHVTTEDFERYARTVAYKVAHNIKNGLLMDEGGDPLTYVDCGE